jgi:hypothetical protein
VIGVDNTLNSTSVSSIREYQEENNALVYYIREYQEGDDENIVSLLDMVFDGWPKYDLPVSNLEYWKWKYLHRKWIDCSIVVGVNKKKEIVGCSHNPFFKVKIGSNEENVQQGVDLAVHPDYRKMGMSKKMDAHLPQNYIAYWSTSNPIVQNNSLYSKSKRFSSDIRIYYKIDDINDYIKKSKTSRKWIARLKILKTIHKMRARKPSSNYDVRIIDSFDDKYDRFWNNVKNNYDFSIIKNREYLNWRYCDKRCGDFKIFQIEEGGEVLGYSVARINRFNPENLQGLIVEILRKEPNPDISDSLFNAIDDYFVKENVNLRKIWVVNQNWVQREILSHGFFDSLNEVFLRFDNLAQNRKEIIDLIPNIHPLRINFHMGDIDAI